MHKLCVCAFPHVWVCVCVCRCCPIRCINAFLSHQTISGPMMAAVKALEDRRVAALQLTETLNLQTPLKHHLKVQTAFCGSGASKRMNCWRARRRRVEWRAPVISPGSDVQFSWSKKNHQKNPNCAFTACRSVLPFSLHATLGEEKKELRKTMSAPFLTPQSYNLQPRSAVRCACVVFNIYSIWFHLFLRL